MALFTYTGSDPSQPSSYIPSSGTPNCSGSPQSMCTLEADDDGNDEPIITEALKDEIINCLQNQINDTHVTLKVRV